MNALVAMAVGSAWAAPASDVVAEQVPIALRTGAVVEVDVGRFDRIVSAEESRLRVEVVSDTRLRVHAGYVTGLATVALWDGDLRMVVFDIAVDGPAPTDAPISQTPVWASTRLLVNGFGAGPPLASLRQEWFVTGGADEDWRVDGYAMFVMAGTPRYAGASLRYDDPDVRGVVGRAGWGLADWIGSIAIDGAGVEVGARDGWRVGAIGGRLGGVPLGNPAPYGGEVHVASARLGIAQVRGAGFLWADPDEGLVGGGRIGVDLATKGLAARADGYWSGAGGGGSLWLDGRIGLFRAHADAAYRGAGTYVPGSPVEGWAARAASTLSWAFDPVILAVSFGGYASESGTGIASQRGLLGADLTWLVSPRLQVGAGWLVEPARSRPVGGEWVDGGVQRGTGSVRWGAPRNELLGTALLTLPFGVQVADSLQLVVLDTWTVRPRWTVNGSAMTYLPLRGPGLSATVRGGFDHRAPWWTAGAFTGVQVTTGPIVRVGPQVGVRGSAYVAPRHEIAAGSWVLWNTGPASYQADLTYTYHGDAVRSDRRPVLGGRVRGRVFEDTDQDGLHDPEEPWLGGVRVATAGVDDISGADGRFVLRHLTPRPHPLIVGGDAWTAVGEPSAWPRRFRPALVEVGVRNDARVVVDAWVDGDGDGARGPGESAVPVGRVRFVDASRTVRATAVGGDPIVLAGVPRVEGQVVVDLADVPEGYVAAGDLAVPVDMTATGFARVAMPFRALHTAGGLVRFDANGDGMAGDEDPPAVGVAVRCDGQIAVTDARGEFLLRDLPAGTYPIVVEGAVDEPVVRFTDRPASRFGFRIAIGDRPADAPAPAPTSEPATLRGLRSVADRIPMSVETTRPVPVYAVWSDRTWRDVSAETSWSSSDPAIASVEGGQVVARAEGRAELTGTWEGQEVHVVVDVAVVQLVGLVLSEPRIALVPGASAALSVRALQTSGAIEDVTARAEWTTSDPSVATVDAEGVVTAVAPGTAEIAARLRGIESFPTTVVVTAP